MCPPRQDPGGQGGARSAREGREGREGSPARCGRSVGLCEGGTARRGAARRVVSSRRQPAAARVKAKARAPAALAFTDTESDNTGPIGIRRRLFDCRRNRRFLFKIIRMGPLLQSETSPQGVSYLPPRPPPRIQALCPYPHPESRAPFSPRPGHAPPPHLTPNGRLPTTRPERGVTASPAPEPNVPPSSPPSTRSPRFYPAPNTNPTLTLDLNVSLPPYSPGPEVPNSPRVGWGGAQRNPYEL